MMLPEWLAMPAQSYSAIDKESTALWRKELDRLSKQHGAMGRAPAPQRRSHHHRPVILFKEQLLVNVNREE